LTKPPLELYFVGLPNVGKSSLINLLTGSELKVGNWPGTTVERRTLSWKCSLSQEPVTIIDLPGSYSLQATSPEEEVTREAILHPANPEARRLLINVLDTTQLERDLYLTLELKELELPMLVVLNLIDEARSFGITVDVAALSAQLGCPVVCTVAAQPGGAEELAEALGEHLPGQASVAHKPHVELGLQELESRFEQVMSLAAQVLSRDAEQAQGTHKWRAFWDNALLHPVFGPVLFLLAMLLVFRFTFTLSDPWITFLGSVQEVLAGWASGLPLPGMVTSFLAEGVIGGLGTVAAFSPVLFFLYLAMSFLERSGFLPRIAVIADRLLRSFGLSGRSMVPLLLGFGCNVPALSACRALDSTSERLKAAIAVPFMACSARLAVFTLFAAIFFPGREANVVFGLYIGGLVVGLLSAILLTGKQPRDDAQSVLEIPPFRIPRLDTIVKQAARRTMAFVNGAGRMVTITVIVVWALLHIPNGTQGDVMSSLYGKLAQAASPVFAPMGVTDPHLVGALIPGIVAKEVVVGSLATSLSGLVPLEPLGLRDGLSQLGTAFGQAVKETGAGIVNLVSGIELSVAPPEEATPELMAELAHRTTAAGALGYLVFILLYTPCVATIAALRDLIGMRWAVLVGGYQLVAAYVLGCLVYGVARLVGFS
jgi:ferrous iron transport protein B